jgi:hypothetical protein
MFGIMRGLVVLPNVAVCPLEEFRILMKLVLEQRLPQRHLNLTLPPMRILPSVEADVADYLVNVIDDPLDDNRRLDRSASRRRLTC